MKKIKYLLAITFIFTLGIINVNAETGKTPGTIQTKEELLYYIYYYGGTATITDNTIKLTKNLELNQDITFNNNEALTLDLNGNGIYLGNNKIFILGASKNIKITDTSKKDTDYIKSESNFTIYNASKSGTITIENTRIIGGGTKPAVYSYEDSKTNIIDSTIQGEKTVISTLKNSQVNITNSNVKIGNTSGETGIENTNGKVNITNSKITIIDASTNGIGIHSNTQNAVTTITNSTVTANKNAIFNEKGTLIINSGTFTSNSQHAVRTTENTTINGGTFISNTMAGLQILENANNIVLNEGIFKTNSNTIGGIAIPQQNNIDTYISKTSTINNKETITKNGLTFTKEQNVIIVSTPKTKSLSTKTYTYNNKVRTPEVKIINNLGRTLIKDKDYKLNYQQGRKNVGTYYTEIIYLNNYKNLNNEKLYFTINPKSTYITSLKKGKKNITLKIKKQKSQTTGYQITYSQNKNFKNSKTIKLKNTKNKKTIKKLKSKKRYYIKVRTYKITQGKTYYSTWSKTKSIVVK